jgi:hypothetical protein
MTQSELLPKVEPSSRPRAASSAMAEAAGEDAVNGNEEAVVESARAVGLLPADLLQPGEIVILFLKPSPWYILLAPLGSLAATTILVLLAIVISDRFNLRISQRDLVLLGIGLVGVRLFWQFLEWLSRIYVLTDRRIIRVKGVLRVQVFETPLKQVQHTYALFSIRERLFGLGTMAFTTAGTAFIEATWEMVARPLQVHKQIVQTLNRYR